MENMMEKLNAEVQQSFKGDVEYFDVSIRKLIILSIITFGLYELYWFYKNWEAIKKVDGKNISPLGRAIFAVFYCHSLFKRVLSDAVAKGYNERYSPGMLTTIYIIIIVAGNILSDMPTAAISSVPSQIILFNLGWFIFSLLTVAPLLTVQKAINYYKNRGKDNVSVMEAKKYSGGEITIIVLGVILTIFTLSGIVIPYILLEAGL